MYYHPTKHPTSGTTGCFLSHMFVIENAWKTGANSILVFEDDITPTKSAMNFAIHQELTAFLYKNPRVEYIQLGYTILPHEVISFFTARRSSNNILAYNGNCAHAYILTRAGMKTVLDAMHALPRVENIDVDVFYKQLFQSRGTGFCVIPQMFGQDFCKENNNLPATSLYYRIMRKASCFSTQTDMFYYMSIIRYHILLISFCIILITILLVHQIWVTNVAK
jgi:GR25 family glycosyltransferase involved in LPS biosynthesis